MATPEAYAAELAGHIRPRIAGHGRSFFVGLDGRSGSGKSTVAAALGGELAPSIGGAANVTVIDGDQFYAGGSAATWTARSAEEKAARVIDWRRQRSVLEQLRAHGAAEWRPFDWEADDWDADTVPLASEPIRAHAGEVVLLEGAYSCRPELHDLLDVLVLLDVPRDVRRAQLLAREGEHYRADWEGRWSSAEDVYFGSVMPPERFDLVLGRPERKIRTGPGR